MALTIAERLGLLEEKGVIGSRVRTATQRAVGMVERYLSRTLDGSSTGHMFVTHLAMALSRAEAGEPLTEAPAALESELVDKQAQVAFARKMLAEIEDLLGLHLPEIEVLFVAAYLVALEQEDVL